MAEASYRPSGRRGPPVRLTVRRVRPTPGSQLALFTQYSYHPFVTDRVGPTLGPEAGHRRHAEVATHSRELKHGVGLGHLPSGRSAASAAWPALNAVADNLARSAGRLGPGGPGVQAKTPRRRLPGLPG